MYMQNDIAAKAAPAFHIDPPRICPRARMAEVERVIEIATAAIPKAQMRKLGGLSFAVARDDDDHSYFGPITSGTIGTTGVQFRFPIPARGTGSRNLDAVAAELADGAALLARSTRALRKLGAAIREVAEEAIETTKGSISPMQLVAIGVTPGHTAEQLKVTVDVQMLGDDLRSGIERVSEHTHRGVGRLEERLKELADKHAARCQVLAKAKVAGATGFIDDSALRILDISGLGRAAGVEMLRLDRQVNFSFGGDSGYDLMAGVHWDDGVVRGYVENRERGNTFRLEARVLLLERDRLPGTTAASLLGCHLGDVADIGFVPGNALITGVKESGEWLYLGLEIGTSPIEAALGA